MNNSPSDQDKRRTFCKVCIGGFTVASAGAVTYPVVTFMGQPVHFSANKPLEVPLEELTVGQAHYAEFQGQQIILLMTEKGPVVLKASCPHLGCNVIWNAADSIFHCPCHGAVFDDSGAVVSGPVSKELAQLPFEIKDGKLIVT